MSKGPKNFKQHGVWLDDFSKEVYLRVIKQYSRTSEEGFSAAVRMGANMLNDIISNPVTKDFKYEGEKSASYKDPNKVSDDNVFKDVLK